MEDLATSERSGMVRRGDPDLGAAIAGLSLGRAFAGHRWLGAALKLCGAWLLIVFSGVALGASFETIRTNQPGWTITWEGLVEFRAPSQAPVPVRTNQYLNFGDSLHTLALSRAVVRLQDWSDLRLRDRTRLEIALPSGGTRSPEIRLHEGEIFFSSRGGPRAFSVETPHAHGIPKGTEFVVRVDAAQTEVTMFDGEVELSNGVDTKPLRSGQQGIATPGRPIQIRPLLEARNIVQWWIYYPGILDLDELSFPPVEQTDLAASLGAYRRGNLLLALRSFPGYPAPRTPSSEAGRNYLAALFLAVGSVDQAAVLLGEGDSGGMPAQALRLLIAAVSQTPASRVPPAASSSRSWLLALSYAHQSTNNLKAALECARHAARAGPGDPSSRSENGFAWARVAELEFSFGRLRTAEEAVHRALALSSENAQAHCIRGFLSAARYRMRDATASFDRAIEIDPALGNAWLGRGLCEKRRSYRLLGFSKPGGWLQDLQTAASLEPRRSLARAYAGKAFGDAGNIRLAHKELEYAMKLDPHDPTPPLYSALQLHSENRPKEAVQELQRSIDLNDNRAVYRSRLLLDQDQATRGASLAKVYQAAGLDDVALREASRAVSYDYASHSAHQFLAESYNALRDPARFNLRYETAWFNELLLANLLSPAGSGLLSQHISQHEYSRLFEENHLGLFSSSEVRSDGQFRQLASHSALLDRTAYNFDLDYQSNRGTRPNSDLDRIEWYSQIKHQLNDRDSLFLLAKFQSYESGDNFQHYDPTNASAHFRLKEDQAPLAFMAWHREWQPGHHTVLAAGRIESDQRVSDRQALQGVIAVDDQGRPLSGLLGHPLDVSYRSRFATWLGEFAQIADTEHQTLAAGLRAQSGEFNSQAVLFNSLQFASNFFNPPASNSVVEGFERLSLYSYETLKLTPTLRFTAGLTYDYLAYPANHRFPPLSSGQDHRDRLSPKIAAVWSPSTSVTFRSLYSRAQGGVSFDDNFRLEPVQLAGFSQAFRSVISESEVGTVAAPTHEIAGFGVDGRWRSELFWGVEIQRVGSVVSGPIGVFEDRQFFQGAPNVVPSQLQRRFDFEENSVRAGLSWLASGEFTTGISYRFSAAQLRTRLAGVLAGDVSVKSDLHEGRLFGQWQHPSGWFSRAELVGLWQREAGYVPARAAEALAQGNLWVGWRFPRRRGEVTVGCLNLTSGDYRLGSLSYHEDLPRERVWVGRIVWQL